ncbi:hypothetical protein B0T21DRAFT_293736 [Apiosordaria backusii]|uniref:Uncharacterized protein n=1 Tax=Apiosordaria backusii TaxID=314023 RepID=A0AA40AX62_9PEZI|nr:hypothetical protein B0T21DRAFT_293736 [Apiosordaria backusii]
MTHSNGSKSGSSRSGTGTGHPDPDYEYYYNDGWVLETFWYCHRCGFGPHTQQTEQCVETHCQHRGPCRKCTVKQEWVHPDR